MLIAWFNNGREIEIDDIACLENSNRFYKDMDERNIDEIEYENIDVVWDCDYDNSDTFYEYMRSYPNFKSSLEDNLDVAKFLEDDSIIRKLEEKIRKIKKLERKIKKLRNEIYN